MNDKTRKALALQIYGDLQNTMINLYSRWQDEREYENINDYSNVAKPIVENLGGIFLEMSKSPFGFTYTLGEATYKIMTTSKHYSFKRVK